MHLREERKERRKKKERKKETPRMKRKTTLYSGEIRVLATKT